MVILRNFSKLDYLGLNEHGKEALKKLRKELAKQLLEKHKSVNKLNPSARKEAIESALQVNKSSKDIARKGAEVINDLWK